MPLLPADFRLGVQRFYEPFMGGAAVTFALATNKISETIQSGTTRRQRQPATIVLNDVNDELTNTYQVIKTHLDELIPALHKLAEDISEDGYYTVRGSNPTHPVPRAARTIYLNRLGFNGLYRVNSTGKFNVPYGKLTRPTVCDTELLQACSNWLQNADIRTGSYTTALNDAEPGDVVYIDPPYIPLSATASFSKYAKDDFRELDHWALAGTIRGLTTRGVRVLMSNSDTPLTREIYGSVLTLRTVSATRSISAAGTSRQRVTEIIGANYDPDSMTKPDVFLTLPIAK